MTNKEIFKKATYDSLDKQVGGKHYQKYENSTRRIYKRKQVAFCRRQRYKIYL